MTAPAVKTPVAQYEKYRLAYGFVVRYYLDLGMSRQAIHLRARAFAQHYAESLSRNIKSAWAEWIN